MNSVDRAVTFGSLWDQLEHLLKARVGDTSLFGKRLVARACEEAALAPHLSDLANLVQLRNVLKHNEHTPLAEATDAASSFVLGMIALLNQTAFDIAAKPVYAVTEDAAISDVADEMAANVYTAVPVVRGGSIVGVFSEATAVRLLVRSASNDGYVPRLVGELGELLDQPDQSDSYAHYRCAANGESATTIFDWFGESTTAGVRLNAVFVTASGTADCLPLGVITAWDLRKIHSPTMR